MGRYVRAKRQETLEVLTGGGSQVVEGYEGRLRRSVGRETDAEERRV